jgi:dTDP-4-amino-4,6-dideoxy-D-galactose acyltransferase
MEIVQLLPWDTDFFELKTGKLDLQNFDPVELTLVLDRALKEGYELLYVTIPDELAIDDTSLKKWGGRLVDRRVDYKIEIGSTEFKNAEPRSVEIHGTRILERPKSSADSTLKYLAVIAGGQSRFVKDTRIDLPKAKRLFEIWIEKSAMGENGETVFLATGNRNEVSGFATICLMGDCARIGLIAVNPENQGQGVGKLLLAALKDFALGQGIREIKVATQRDNIAANQLYSSANFVVDSSEKVYHFLLR